MKWIKIDESLRLTLVIAGAMFLVPALGSGIALAQDAASQIETRVAVNYGAALASLLEGAGNLLFVTLSGAVATFSPGVWAFMRIARLDQLLKNALNKAVEEFRADMQDERISVDLRNKVLADAARYALDNGAKSVIAWAGGEKGIRDKLQARFQEAVAKWMESKKR